jgi:hypothetical protein
MCVSKKTLGLIGLLILLPSCSVGGAGSFCAAARPIYVTPRDALDRGTAADILAHNETGARLCGWQPIRR